MTTETTQNDATADAVEAAPTTALGDAAATEAAAEAGDGEAVAADAAAAAADASAAVTILGAPEAYDATAFTMPEGVEFDSELFDLVKDDLKGMDLSQTGAERVVGMFAEKVAPKIAERAVKAIDDAAAELSANLARDLQADPEVGGAKLKESQAYAAKAISHFIPDARVRADFSKFLNESGLGNHPLLTRVIAGAGRAISEASTPAAETASAPLSESQKFYG
jgi:hypothetical protein